MSKTIKRKKLNIDLFNLFLSEHKDEIQLMLLNMYKNNKLPIKIKSLFKSFIKNNADKYSLGSKLENPLVADKTKLFVSTKTKCIDSIEKESKNKPVKVIQYPFTVDETKELIEQGYPIEAVVKIPLVEFEEILNSNRETKRLAFSKLIEDWVSRSFNYDNNVDIEYKGIDEDGIYFNTIINISCKDLIYEE